MTRSDSTSSPESYTHIGDSMSFGAQKGSRPIPWGSYKYISEKLEKLLPSLYIQKATKLQEARLETDPKPRTQQQLNFRPNPSSGSRPGPSRFSVQSHRFGVRKTSSTSNTRPPQGATGMKTFIIELSQHPLLTPRHHKHMRRG